MELVFEAFDPYWRKTPSVKRLVLKSIPEEATRLAALKRGEVDIAYNIRGELAEELLRTPRLILKPVYGATTFWLDFPERWDPKSPWNSDPLAHLGVACFRRCTVDAARGGILDQPLGIAALARSRPAQNQSDRRKRPALGDINFFLLEAPGLGSR